ncbi:hypothetical protein [Kitasatospora sp. DSM 101779]|uniref:hypothetical protein n=1 Tax=Kitasatospora sp. DSM 101779 TaxID=2853165 RepID=UPI0021DACE83|nr:hypothetical protein [Kitasatospora sp. DSM 101779]MCU7823528.1 hypothetical protein [Kitasatospora sp. DSM 101779]
MRNKTLGRVAAALLGSVVLAVAAPAATAAPALQPTATAGTSFLGSGERLAPGQSLTSGESSLVMQGDGNLVLYLVGPTGNHGPAVWHSGTFGHPGAYAYMQPDGNLVVYRRGGSAPSDALWSSGSWGHPGAYAQLLDGWWGVNSSTSGMLWQTATGVAPAVDGPSRPESVLDSSRGIRPGQWITSNSVWLVNQTDGNLVLYRKRDGAALWSTRTSNRPSSIAFVSNVTGALYLSTVSNGLIGWSTPNLHSPGAYARVQDDGNLVIYRKGRSDPAGALWSTGTWGNR